MKARKILVAVKNLEARSLPAVLKAAQIARASGAEIELFHALAEPIYLDVYELSKMGADAVEEQLKQRARQRLEAIADRLRVHSIRVSISVGWDFPVYEAIVRQAVKSNSDLIVAQRYGGKHTAAALMQLTDWELIKISPVPILLVKSVRPYRHPAVLAAVDPGHRFAKTSQLDRSILRAGGLLSRQLRGTLHAVYGYDAVSPAGLSEAMSGRVIDVLDRESRRAAAVRFEQTLGSHRIARSRRYLLAARPIDAIAEAARRSRSAIVVMGAVSRSGLKRLLIGNTAERILDALTCDVLVVKPDGFRERLSRIQRGSRLRVAAPTNTLGYY
ncbi:MAG TPA: universal stress protein [Steroidobacteraceae bacterium]|jgi:universal stress protein E|nr:universal stress protein [Steroidobacteraceae bacterium]